MDSGIDGAAWTQAIGSVLALLIAVWVPIWHSDRADKRRTATQVGTILGLAESAFAHVEDVQIADIGRGYAEHSPTGLMRETSKLLQSIPVQEFQDHRMVMPVLEFARALDSFASNLLGVDAEIDQHGDTHPDTDEAMDKSLTAMRAAMENVRKIAAEYKLQPVALI
jgi:hypothetical protein